MLEMFVPGLFCFLAFLFGLIIGSFLNVCIYRLPRGESVLWPGSQCPQCKHPIEWFDNIPVASFLFLSGRCRHCKAAISIQYPFVEVISGLFFLLSWAIYGWSGFFFITVIFLSLLLVIILTDFETGLIPDLITFPGIVLGLAASFLYPSLQDVPEGLTALGRSFIGLLTGGILIYTVGMIGKAVFKKDSMGGGDVKLLAMIGSFLGWEKVILTFFIAPFFALPFAVYSRWIKKEETIPYGPFLAVAAILQYFFGEQIWKLILGK